MLTREENRWNFKALEVLSFCNFIPIEFNRKTAQMQQQSCHLRWTLWVLTCIAAHLVCLYQILQLIHSFLVPCYFKLSHLVIHVLFTVSLMGACFVHRSLFLVNLRENLIVFNALFSKDGDTAQLTLWRVKSSKSKSSSRSRSQVEGGGGGEDQEAGRPSRRGSSSWSAMSILTDLVHRVSSRTGASTTDSKPRKVLDFNYSRHELLAMFLSQLCGAGMIFFLVVVGSDMSRIQFLFFSLPQQHKNVVTFSLFYLFEMYIGSFMGSSYYYTVLVELLALEKCDMELSGFGICLRDLRKMKVVPIQILQKLVQDMRELCLFIHLINLAFSYIVFCYKITFITLSTFSSWCTIKIFMANPFLSACSLMVFFNATVFFAIVFEKSFCIRIDMERWKRESRVQVQRLKNMKILGVEYHSRRLARELDAVKTRGIQVGSFHVLERQSTPNFIDFIIKQVTSLLMATNSWNYY